jgi:hypothetical protein
VQRTAARLRQSGLSVEVSGAGSPATVSPWGAVTRRGAWWQARTFRERVFVVSLAVFLAALVYVLLVHTAQQARAHWAFPPGCAQKRNAWNTCPKCGVARGAAARAVAYRACWCRRRSMPPDWHRGARIVPVAPRWQAEFGVALPAG